MSDAQANVKVSADTSQAEAGLDSLANKAKSTEGSIANLGKAGEGAGRQLGALSGTVTSTASAMGASTTQVQGLAMAMRLLTGAINPVTIGISAVSAAILIFNARQQAAKKALEEQAAAAREAARVNEDAAQQAARAWANTLNVMERFRNATAGAAASHTQALLAIAASDQERLSIIGSRLNAINRELGVDTNYRAQIQDRVNSLRQDEINLMTQMERAQIAGRDAEVTAIERSLDRIQRERGMLMEANSLRERQNQLTQQNTTTRTAENRVIDNTNELLREALRLKGLQQAASDRALQVAFQALSEEAQMEERMNRLRAAGIEEVIDLRTHALEVAQMLLTEESESRRAALEQELDDYQAVFNYQERIREEAAARELQDRMDLAEKLKQANIDAMLAEQAEFERLQAMRLQTIKETLSATQQFTTGAVNSMVNVYAGATKKEAKERRKALGSSLIAEGLANVISSPARLFTGGPAAVAIQAGTGTAQMAFGKALGGSLGATGGGGGAGRGADAPAPSTTNTTQNINETNTVNYNLGMVGDPRELALRTQRSNTTANRNGMRGL
jgi:hypothetical protein